MKPDSRSYFRRGRIVLLLGGFLLIIIAVRSVAAAIAPSEPYRPTGDEFLAISNSVLTLLRTRDVEAFARENATTVEDWKSVLSTNLPAPGDDPLKNRAKESASTRESLAESAKDFLAKAADLHVDFSHGDWRLRLLLPRFCGSAHFPDIQAQGEFLPWLQEMEAVVEPADGANASTNGEYKLVLNRLLKFPAGWRLREGIQWISFPSNVADAKTSRELALAEKVMSGRGFSGEDDPALLKFEEALARFLRERNPQICERELLVNADFVWAMVQKSGRKGPSRKEVDAEIGPRVREQLSTATNSIRLMDDASIDLSDAEIKIVDASVERSQSAGGVGSLDNVLGSQFRLELSVKSQRRAKNGAPLSGNYVFGARDIFRADGVWKVQDDLHWVKLPAGIVDAGTLSKIEFENYVAEHDTLPPKTAAPEIEFTTLAGVKKMKLSDLRGKVVVLDFWATWCGPCQQPMADLQKIRDQHPQWRDRVAIVPLSIDDALEVARKHVDKRGWTNTFNAWAGEGGWLSTPARSFRVTGVPTTYIIDAQEKIVSAGHPASLPIAETVDELLDRPPTTQD